MVLLLHWSHHSTSHGKFISCSFYAGGWVVHQLVSLVDLLVAPCGFAHPNLCLTHKAGLKGTYDHVPLRSLGFLFKLRQDQQKVLMRTLTIAHFLFANNVVLFGIISPWQFATESGEDQEKDQRLENGERSRWSNLVLQAKDFKFLAGHKNMEQETLKE